MSDRVLRFNSATNTFIAYPMPTRVSYLRDIAFTADGQVCSSSSNLPAYGIEGGRGSFLCIDPDGNARPMKAKEADAGRSNAQAANVR
jgi:virginiamycin B lyase